MEDPKVHKSVSGKANFIFSSIGAAVLEIWGKNKGDAYRMGAPLYKTIGWDADRMGAPIYKTIAGLYTKP